ncbi:MAG: hypothetical protein V3R66_07505, partial [Rhodospirillales bacterium]
MQHYEKLRKKKALFGKMAAMSRRQKKGKQDKAETLFIGHYFDNVPTADIIEKNPETLLAIARGHLEFGRSRLRGRPKVRVFNPTFKEHGWDSDHTVIEIVN